MTKKIKSECLLLDDDEEPSNNINVNVNDNNDVEIKKTVKKTKKKPFVYNPDDTSPEQLCRLLGCRLQTIKKFEDIDLKYNESAILNNHSMMPSKEGIIYYLLTHRKMSYQCQICDQSPVWNQQYLRLFLDNINNVASDYNLDNIRFLCPNCYSQTNGSYKIKANSYAKTYCSQCGHQQKKSTIKYGLCVICREATQKQKLLEPEINIASPISNYYIPMVNSKELLPEIGQDIPVSQQINTLMNIQNEKEKMLHAVSSLPSKENRTPAYIKNKNADITIKPGESVMDSINRYRKKKIDVTKGMRFD